jgi:hypothetical protein
VAREAVLWLSGAAAACTGGFGGGLRTAAMKKIGRKRRGARACRCPEARNRAAPMELLRWEKNRDDGGAQL